MLINKQKTYVLRIIFLLVFNSELRPASASLLIQQWTSLDVAIYDIYALYIAIKDGTYVLTGVIAGPSLDRVAQEKGVSSVAILDNHSDDHACTAFSEIITLWRIKHNNVHVFLLLFQLIYLMHICALVLVPRRILNLLVI